MRNDVTLRADLASWFAAAGIADVDLDQAVDDEHLRISGYLRVISAVTATPDHDRTQALAAALARDPDQSAARTTIVDLVDTIAAQTHDPSDFQLAVSGILAEAQRLEPESNRQFIRNRVAGWSLHHKVMAGHIPSQTELAAATAWAQRLIAQDCTSVAALAALAEYGSTRKIRSIASNHARSREAR
jgi:hypothetical protein